MEKSQTLLPEKKTGSEMMTAVRKETEEFIDTLMVHHFSEEGIRKAFQPSQYGKGMPCGRSR